MENIDDSKATSKITITITGAYFNDDKSEAFVKTNWVCEGNPLKVSDLIHVFESGKKDMLDFNEKNNPEIKK